MAPWQDILTALFLVTGGIFGLVGSVGLMKLPTPMARLHAPTKATTLGIGSLLIASMLYFLLERGGVYRLRDVARHLAEEVTQPTVV